MGKHFKILTAHLSVLILAAGCAASMPVPFQLVDSASAVQRGTLFPDSERIEVTLDGQVYTGFFIIASGSAVSHATSGRRFFPSDTVTTFSSNSARALLTANDGKRLSCEFLLESKRALGECRTPAGAVYQLSADGN